MSVALVHTGLLDFIQKNLLSSLGPQSVPLGVSIVTTVPSACPCHALDSALMQPRDDVET